MKLWEGRFGQKESPLMESFNSSIRIDGRMYRQDILGNLAYAEELFRIGIFSRKEFVRVKNNLIQLLKRLEQQGLPFTDADEDIHMAIEKYLIERLGPSAKKIHTGRSRNDQVLLDVKLYLKDRILKIFKKLVNLQEVLVNLAQSKMSIMLPGYTHLQQAQPILYSHYLLALVFMLRRDGDRLADCLKRMDEMPLGSGALAGTTYPINRNRLAKKLGFSEISFNSLDAVSDRDFMVELLSILSILIMHLSRYCEDLIIWSTSEFQFVEMDDQFSTGSSMMPQKKNPDALELIRGKTGRIFGALLSLLTLLKGLPFAYNKDLQEDKASTFQALDEVDQVLTVFNEVIKSIKIKQKPMIDKMDPFILATDVADYLVRKGVPFRDAHRIVGKIVHYGQGQSKSWMQWSVAEFQKFSKYFDRDIFQTLDLRASIEKRNNLGGTGTRAVKIQIAIAKNFLKKSKTYLKGLETKNLRLERLLI